MVIELRRTRLPDGGWVTLYSDITARKQAEDAQARAREQAEIAAQEKSRFVAIVSHEIRTPLNVALNSLGLLDQSDLTPAQRQLVESGLLAGESLLGLLNDILDLSRMQVGRLQLRPAPFMLRPLLEGVVELFRHQAEERGVELSVHLAPGVPERLMTDSGRLRQALMNLVNNAAKFAEPGPASIRVGFATMDGSRCCASRCAIAGRTSPTSTAPACSARSPSWSGRAAAAPGSAWRSASCWPTCSAARSAAIAPARRQGVLAHAAGRCDGRAGRLGAKPSAGRTRTGCRAPACCWSRTCRPTR